MWILNFSEIGHMSIFINSDECYSNWHIRHVRFNVFVSGFILWNKKKGTHIQYHCIGKEWKENENIDKRFGSATNLITMIWLAIIYTLPLIWFTLQTHSCSRFGARNFVWQLVFLRLWLGIPIFNSNWTSCLNSPHRVIMHNIVRLE